MTHILIIGGYDVNMVTVKELGLTLSFFQKNAMVSPMQAETAKRLYAFDYEDVAEAVALARVVHEREPLHGVASFTELGLEIAAAIRQDLGINGNSLLPVTVTRDKIKMRSLMAERGIPSARYQECHTPADLERFFISLGGPLILKPAKGSGSDGISLVSARSDLASAWLHSSSVKLFPLIAEEYFDGPEVSVETLSFDGKHEIIAITEKITTGKPCFVETGHQLPARLPADEQRAIEEVVSSFLTAIEHQLGPAHTELRLTQAGPKLIESQTRPGGDFIWEMVLLGRGVDLVRETLQHLTSMPRPARDPGAGAAAVRFFTHGNRTVARIEGLEEAAKLPGVAYLTCSAKPGDVLGPVLSSDDRQGYVLATGATTDLACANAERAFAAVTFHFVE